MQDTIFSLAGKTALVTGASSGFGEHFARTLARAGARVAVGARRGDRLAALVDSLQAEGCEAMAVTMDVTSADSVTAALDAVEDAFGGVDILVNNAGVGASRHCLKADEENWDFIVGTNLKGVWRVAQAVAARAVSAGRPCSIVNIASILGLRVGFGESVYATAKAGVVQLTKAMAMELVSKSIRVNAICPGYFSTEINADYLASEKGQAMLKGTPAGRAGRIEELDGALLLLASDAGSFMTGTAIPVDGGHLVSSL